MKQATSQAASDGFTNFVSALTSYSWGRRGKDAWHSTVSRGSAVSHTSAGTVPA